MAAAKERAMPRYLIERTLGAGTVDRLTDEDLRSAQTTNAVYGVRWIHTYINRDKTKTFCIYEGPDEWTVREANARNGYPIDRIIEIPSDLAPI
jgi:hypothetical protein